jgi:hypothetical protein
MIPLLASHSGGMRSGINATDDKLPNHAALDHFQKS